jgi:hypothetical protein
VRVFKELEIDRLTKRILSVSCMPQVTLLLLLLLLWLL